MGHPPGPEPSGPLAPNAQTGTSPAWPSAATSRSAPASSHPACSAGSSGIRPSGTSRNGDGLAPTGADDLGRPALDPADVGGQLAQRPVRAGGHRQGEVSPIDQRGQGPGAGGDFRVVALGGEHAAGRGQPQPHAPPQQPPPPPPERGAGRRGPAADRDRGQQLDRVVVPLRAQARLGRFAHRPGLLERRSAGPAPVLVTWHSARVRAPGCPRRARGSRRALTAQRNGLAEPAPGPAE